MAGGAGSTLCGCSAAIQGPSLVRGRSWCAPITSRASRRSPFSARVVVAAHRVRVISLKMSGHSGSRADGLRHCTYGKCSHTAWPPTTNPTCTAGTKKLHGAGAAFRGRNRTFISTRKWCPTVLDDTLSVPCKMASNQASASTIAVETSGVPHDASEPRVSCGRSNHHRVISQHGRRPRYRAILGSA